MNTQTNHQKLLFLCTGNYYRSRFAEILFNTLAHHAGLDWKAESRGLAMERGSYNVGPISEYALQGLAARAIPLDPNLRLPLKVTPQDFDSANKIIALCETEHRPLMLERYAEWADHVTYWHVEDVLFTNPAEALAEIDRQVCALIECLGECRPLDDGP